MKKLLSVFLFIFTFCTVTVAQTRDFIIKAHDYTYNCAKGIAEDNNVAFTKTYGTQDVTNDCKSVTDVYHFSLNRLELKRQVELGFRNSVYTLKMDKDGNPVYQMESNGVHIFMTVYPESSPGIGVLMIQVVHCN